MNIDSIKNGIVIDHIEAKKGLEIYKILKLDELDCSVAIITNARSKKMGKKDIIKIDKNIRYFFIYYSKSLTRLYRVCYTKKVNTNLSRMVL